MVKNIFTDNSIFSLTIRLGAYHTHVDFSCSFLKQRHCHKLVFILCSISKYLHTIFILITFYICLSFHSSSMDYDLVISIYYTKTYIHWIILNHFEYTGSFPNFSFPAHWSYVKQQRGIWLGFLLVLIIFMILPISRASWGKNEFQPKKSLWKKMFYIINMEVNCVEMKWKQQQQKNVWTDIYAHESQNPSYDNTRLGAPSYNIKLILIL